MPATRKKGQYFTLDAFIASMIVAVAIMIVLATRVATSQSPQSEILTKGLSESLSSAKLSELNNPLVIIMAKNGTITNLDNTVLQQAAEFYFLGYRHQAFELLKNVTYRLVPARFNLKILVNNEVVYNSTSRPYAENTSSSLIASRRIVFGVVNRTALVYGPAIAEVRVWQ